MTRRDTRNLYEEQNKTWTRRKDETATASGRFVTQINYGRLFQITENQQSFALGVSQMITTAIVTRRVSRHSNRPREAINHSPFLHSKWKRLLQTLTTT